MLYHLLAPFADHAIFFNLFRYLTFRTGGALITALSICFIFGPAIIRWLKARQGEGQPIRSDGPESHFSKRGTPTMGGLMMLLSIVVSTVLWADTGNAYVWLALLITLLFGLIGFVDDWRKLTRRSSAGLSGKLRLGLQLALGGLLGLGVYCLSPPHLMGGLALPVFKDILLPLGLVGFVIFSALVIAGSANAVNFTDGLDGLAAGPLMIAAACFALIAYLVGNAIFANYLQVHFVPGAGELAVFGGAIVGACLGFLWFNAPPAKVFMGDTGSLSLGGALGAMAVITKHELVLFIIGGLFVAETVSVMLQVASYKLTGKRIFKMAPLHHHFEKLGWSEPTVVIRFWIVAIILAIIGLSTLKLR